MTTTKAKRLAKAAGIEFKAGDAVILTWQGQEYRGTILEPVGCGYRIAAPIGGDPEAFVTAADGFRRARSTPQQAYEGFREAFNALARGRKHYSATIAKAAQNLAEIAAASPEYAASHYENTCEPVMYAAEMLALAGRYAVGSIDCPPEQFSANDPSGPLAERIERLTHYVLEDDGYRHNCTCEATSIRNRQQFKAKQDTLRQLKDMARYLDRMRQCVAWAEAGLNEVPAAPGRE